MRKKYGRFHSRAVFNGIGSRKRNGEQKPGYRHSYGFAADVRQKFEKLWKQVRKPRVSRDAPFHVQQAQVKRAWYEFIGRPWSHSFKWYGQEFIMHQVYPYIVVTVPNGHEATLSCEPDGMVTGNVVAVMPVMPDATLTNLWKVPQEA